MERNQMTEDRTSISDEAIIAKIISEEIFKPGIDKIGGIERVTKKIVAMIEDNKECEYNGVCATDPQSVDYCPCGRCRQSEVSGKARKQ
jgi:hypothetical protein